MPFVFFLPRSSFASGQRSSRAAVLRVLASFAVALMPVAGALSTPASAQDDPSAQSGSGSVTTSTVADALNSLQPTMASVNLALTSVDVRRWKVPGDVKDQTNSDMQSIQRDLAGALPGLITQAQSAPNAIAPSFAVFRNIDALYDVLLRVAETATLAGSQQEAGHLESARADLQTRRRQLGDALLNSATAQDANVVQLHTSLTQATQAAAVHPADAAPKKVVVDDGPAAPAKTVHKKKAVKPATPPANPPAPQQ